MPASLPSRSTVGPATRMRRVVLPAIAALVVMVAGFTGCAIGTTPGPAPSSRTSTPPTTVLPPTTTSAATDPANPTTGFPSQAPVTHTSRVNAPTAFTSPSGRIVCVVGLAGAPGTVRCEIDAATWQIAQPAGKSCEPGEWVGGGGAGQRGLFLIDGRPRPDCAGEPLRTMPSAERPLLDYGQAIDNGTATCVSERVGVRCQVNQTGQGFRISYERAEFLCVVDGRLQPAPAGADPCS